jgi:CubicO group peptidase (beta-lactamase class C family)
VIKVSAPESAGMSGRRLNEIGTVMQRFVEQGKVAGIATLVARQDKVVHFGCTGYLDVTANKTIEPDSLFRIYSLTKPITSVAALMLYEEGCFGLDDPVSEWIPGFSRLSVMGDSARRDAEMVDLERDITIWHLLTHTAGLGYGFNREPIERLYRDAKILSPLVTLQHSLPELIQAIVKLPLCAQPGDTWHYSVAHDVLGYLIGEISGKRFDVFLQERIFEPLGMKDTSFYVPEEKRGRFGPLYGASEEGGLSIVDDVATSPFVRPDVVPSGGVGLVSSMSDYFRFLVMLAHGGELEGVRLLQQDTVTAMLTNQLSGPAYPVRFNDEPWRGMGFGLGVGVKVEGKPRVGWIGISGTTAWIYPGDEMIVIAMPQVFFDWEAADTLLRMARDAIAA